MQPEKIDRTDTAGLLRVSELARQAGVSLPTIHFYVKEGLIAPALKTARNMAYYSPQCIEDIRMIKELQARQYLPLSIIKLLIKARQEGQGQEHVAEMQHLFTDLFFVDKAQSSVSLTLEEMIRESGLLEPDIKTLLRYGLLEPHDNQFDDLDLQVARTVKKLLELGLEIDDLSIYTRFVESTRMEFELMHEKIHRLHSKGDVKLLELGNCLSALKKSITKKVLRGLALEAHSDRPNGGSDDS